MNGTLRTVDGRFVLRMERRLAHPPEKVWRAITEPAHLSSWFPADMEMALEVGAKIRFVFREGEAPTMDGVIIELDPPRVFAYTWDQDLLRWELRADADGSLLTFTHTFDDRPAAASYATGWHTCIDALGALLDGRSAEAQRDTATLHQAYAEALGLTEGSAEVTADGWQVRFERQLTQPIEAIWAMLTASGPVAPTQDASARVANAPVIGDPPPRAFTTGSYQTGVVTAANPPTILEYDWQRAGRTCGKVSWRLSQGTGHGARLALTHTGPSNLAAEQPTALSGWQTHIENLAKQLLDAPA